MYPNFDDDYALTRADLIASGHIVPHTNLHDMYRDGVVSPACDMPWHRDDACLRLDKVGVQAADADVALAAYESLYYHGEPPSQAAARRYYRVVVEENR